MSAAPSQETDFAALRTSLLSRFEMELREQRDIDAASRESMLGFLEQTLSNMDPAQLEIDPTQVRSSLGDTIELLGRNGLIDASGSDEVHRAFASTLQVFENPGVQRALEFARISREQGEDAARAWLADNATPRQPSVA